MVKILNLTQHKATPDQVAAGVIDLSDDDRAILSRLLTMRAEDFQFEDDGDEYFPRYHPKKEIIDAKINQIITIAQKYHCEAAMVGGMPYLIYVLKDHLRRKNIIPCEAFSERVSVDGPDGKKTSVFKHLFFY